MARAQINSENTHWVPPMLGYCAGWYRSRNAYDSLCSQGVHNLQGETDPYIVDVYTEWYGNTWKGIEPKERVLKEQ